MKNSMREELNENLELFYKSEFIRGKEVKDLSIDNLFNDLKLSAIVGVKFNKDVVYRGNKITESKVKKWLESMGAPSGWMPYRQYGYICIDASWGEVIDEGAVLYEYLHGELPVILKDITKSNGFIEYWNEVRLFINSIIVDNYGKEDIGTVEIKMESTNNFENVVYLIQRNLPKMYSCNSFAFPIRGTGYDRIGITLKR